MILASFAIDGTLWALTAYNTYETYKAFSTAMHTLGEESLEIAKEIENATKNLEGLEKIETLISAFNLTDKVDLKKALMNDKSYREEKISEFINAFENADKIINDFNDSKKFDLDEKIALKMKNLNPNYYVPIKFVIYKWASFFKQFIDNLSSLMQNVNSQLFEVLKLEQDKINYKNLDDIEFKAFKEKKSLDKVVSKIKTDVIDKSLTLLYVKSRKLRLNKEKLSTLKKCLTVVKVKTLLNKPVK